MRRAAALLALFLAAAPLQAATVSGIFTVNALGFSPSGPPDPASFTFVIAFDNSADITDSTVGIMLLASILPLGSPISFTYEVAGDNLFVGGLSAGADAAAYGTSDFILVTSGISSNIVFAGLAVTQDNQLADLFIASSGTIQRQPTLVPVSAPGALALLGVALAGLGLLRRARPTRFAAALFALALAASPLRAAPVGGVYDVTASGILPAGPPDPVAIRLFVLFDNGADITNQTTNVQILNSNLALGSPIAFTYLKSTDTLFVGGLNNGAAGAITGTDDFILILNRVSGSIGFERLDVTRAGVFGDLSTTDTGTIRPVLGASPVSAPASLALMGVALAGLGLMRHRRA